MTIIQRIRDIVIGLLLVICGIILIVLSDYDYLVVCTILFLSLFLYGFRNLIYYFSMARYMVGGQRVLIQAVVILDLALFSISLTYIPKTFVIIYLVAIYAFAGGIDVMRAMEAKKYRASTWKIKMAQGIINLLIALACLIFIKSPNTVAVIYGVGLIYSAVVRVYLSFRKTETVFIQ